METRENILPAAALGEARAFFATKKLNEENPTLFIQPFTSNFQINWPLENFLKVARYFHSRGAQIIFGGGPSERALPEPARTAGFCVSAGLMKFSSAVVGADTGLLHLGGGDGQTRRAARIRFSTQT